MDGIGQAEKYTELPMEKTIDTMLSNVKQKRSTREQLSEVSSVITGAANELAIPTNVIEKDYYVTITLKALAEKTKDIGISLH